MRSAQGRDDPQAQADGGSPRRLCLALHAGLQRRGAGLYSAAAAARALDRLVYGLNAGGVFGNSQNIKTTALDAVDDPGFDPVDPSLQAR